MLSWLRHHAQDINGLWAPLASIFANLLVVAALAIAFLTYQQGQQQATVAQSMSYVERFNSGELMAAQNMVFRSWIPHNLEAIGDLLTRDALDDLIAETVAADDLTDSAFPLRTALVNIVGFFDGAYACMKAAVCDGKLLQSELGAYSHDFYCIYRGFIASQAKMSRLSGFGDGLKPFASMRGECSAVETAEPSLADKPVS